MQLAKSFHSIASKCVFLPALCTYSGQPAFGVSVFNKFTRLPTFVMNNYVIFRDEKWLQISTDESLPEGIEVIKSVQSDSKFESQRVAEIVSEAREGQEFICKWVKGINPEICRAINAAPGVRLQFG